MVSLVSENDAPGGAGNVAATLAGLGCRVTLAGLAGADTEGVQLREALHAKGVTKLSLLQRPDLQTITKTRILSDSQQQLLRLDRDGDRMAFAAASEKLLPEILPLVDSQAAVVLADYDKGVITPASPMPLSTAAGSEASLVSSTPRSSISASMLARRS